MTNKDFAKLLLETRQSNDISKLIRKLRWVGLEEEARQLQRSLLNVPAYRVAVPSEPLCTD